MKKNKKGFTLVELVIVVAVMAVLIAVAIPTVTSITRTAKETVANTNAQTIESTLKLKEADMNKDGAMDKALGYKEIWDAVSLAKLGITEGSYIYDPSNGTVTAVLMTAGSEVPTDARTDGEYEIAFNGTSLTVIHDGGEYAGPDDEGTTAPTT